MAKVSNGFSTYNDNSKREKFLDAIYNTDPFDTFFLSTSKRMTVGNRTWQWQNESLPEGTVAPKNEGFVVQRDASTPTKLVYNNTQINSENATVTDTQEHADLAGKPEGEMNHQLALKTKALKIVQEKALLSNNPRNPGNDGTPRSTRGLEHWITTNVTSGAGYVNPADDLSNGTDGTLRDFTKDVLDDAMELGWDNNADYDTIFLAGSLRRKVSQFTPRNGTQTIVRNEMLLGGGITIYMSDFGDIKVVPSRFLPRKRTAFLLDMKRAKTAYFKDRAFKTKVLPADGDFESKMIVSEFGLHVDNEKFFGKITDLNVG